MGEVDIGGGAYPASGCNSIPACSWPGIQLGFDPYGGPRRRQYQDVPKGHLDDRTAALGNNTNDQLPRPQTIAPLVIAYRNGVAVHVGDVGNATDSVEDLRQAGYMDGKPAVMLVIFRQPGANIIQTVDRICAALPQLKSAIPRGIDLTVAMDQTVTIRASVQEVEITLVISVLACHSGGVSFSS